MSPAAIFGVSYGSLALLTFYAMVRRYTNRLRAEDLSDGWDAPGIFMFSLVMCVIWPLTMLWVHATRPSRAERRAEQDRQLRRIVEDNERKARRLGIGE